MMHIYIIPVLALLLPHLHASAQVPLITGNFTFLTPRYSNYIGGFDEECSITAPMVKLSPDEDLCDLDTIRTNVSERVLITFVILEYGCYEEVAYENAIKLGALAVIDSVGIPPGFYFSVHNARQSFKKGDIPFVQVGYEFYEAFALEEFSPGFEYLDGTLINIEGCADTSQILECYDSYQVILIVFSFISLFGVFLAYKSVTKLKITPSTRPRIALIAYEAIFLLLNAFLLFFGLTLRQAKNLLDGSFVSAQAKDILGTLQVVAVIYGCFMNAIYWSALPFGLCTFFFIQFLTLLENYYRCDIDEFERFLQIAIWIDIIGGVALLCSMTYFILTLRKISDKSSRQEVFSNEKGCWNKLNFVWLTIKGIVNGENFVVKQDTVNTEIGSTINTKLINLALHLTKWLTLYILLMILSCCLILYGLFAHFPFGIAQDDPDGCKIFSFYFGFICVRVLTSYCKILGLRGPSIKKEENTKNIEQYITNNQEQQTQPRLYSANPFLTTQIKPNLNHLVLEKKTYKIRTSAGEISL
eukprot:snap_masked-scaffold_12-processed-gene-2.16-mRNA-1 protein AED:1.00 eAED:1.00 QI:0/0/0/0/1/1/2/0/528